MARYIDADKLIARLKVSPIFQDFGTDGYFIRDMVIDLVENQHTADVVPKSEVEKLVQDVTRLEQEIETLKDNNEHLAVMLTETKAEVAREIFAEIYEDCFDQFGYINYEALAELRKKYIPTGVQKSRVEDKEFFTPEEVRKMSNAEVRQNYAKILNSMSKWHEEHG